MSIDVICDITLYLYKLHAIEHWRKQLRTFALCSYILLLFCSLLTSQSSYRAHYCSTHARKRKRIDRSFNSMIKSTCFTLQIDLVSLLGYVCGTLHISRTLFFVYFKTQQRCMFKYVIPPLGLDLMLVFQQVWKHFLPSVCLYTNILHFTRIIGNMEMMVENFKRGWCWRLPDITKITVQCFMHLFSYRDRENR